MPRLHARPMVLAVIIGLNVVPATAQPAAAQGPAPTFANVDYAPPEPPAGNGHKLDLYIPAGATAPLPLVVWTGGSAWRADTGKNTARGIAAQLNPAGYAVAGVSIRSSSQVLFPGQLYDIKAAIRWLRANAAKYNLDPDHIAIMGDSSGGWTAAMAAVTGDAPEMEGAVGTTGVSSAVQAAVAFYPPTNFSVMDAWAIRKCAGEECHDSGVSPESRLVGCAIQTCPGKVKAASPLTYVSAADPPIMILHGNSDPLVPHNQGEQLYMALNKACRDAVFISLPKAGHGPPSGFLTNADLREGATMRSTAAAGCLVANPVPFTPSWRTVIEFLDRHMKSPAQMAALPGSSPIRPGEVWLDDRGRHVQAHGGGIVRVEGVYYWFGEDRSQGLDPSKRYVSCYSSEDLTHWTFRNQVIKLADPEGFGPTWVLERPKVFYNAKTKQFVMYMHIDGPLPGEQGGYKLARVGVAVSDKVDGDYKYLKSFRPLGRESRDIGQFIDDDGTAYLIFEDRPYGFRIATLSDDYLNVEKEVCLIPLHMEGGAVVHYDGLYYAIGSQLTGWRPNPNKYATAKSLEGPWSEFKDIAPPETNTYGSQSTMMLKVVGTKGTTVIFMGDIWKPGTQWDSRYLWMPLEIGGGKLRLPEPRPWTLDLASGTVSVIK